MSERDSRVAAEHRGSVEADEPRPCGTRSARRSGLAFSGGEQVRRCTENEVVNCEIGRQVKVPGSFLMMEIRRHINISGLDLPLSSKS